MCSTTLTLTILATQRQICCLSREKCLFFFLVFSWFFFSYFHGNLVVCSRDDFRWKKVVLYLHDSEHSMLQAGKTLPSTSHHLPLQFRENDHTQTPSLLSTLKPVCSTVHCSKNSSAAAQGAWTRASPAVGAWTTSKRQRTSPEIADYFLEKNI